MSDPSKPRVAIVGGGPAGATCARMLAAAGLKVTLFEARPSSEKPCGGGVPGDAIQEFPLLADPALPRRVVRHVLLHAPSGHTASVPVREGIHVFRRHDLDSFLRQAAALAGTELRTTRVTAVSGAPAGPWEIRTEEGAEGPFDFLVGADGVNGVVRRHVATPFRDGDLTLGLFAYVPGVRREEMVLKFPGDLDGYIWAFPRHDHVSVGIGVTYRSVPQTQIEEMLHRFVEDHYPEGRFDRAALKGYFIPATEHPPSPAPGETWALIGDAGGFVDPLTREGIAPAMRSAAALARAFVHTGRLSTPALTQNLRKAYRYRRSFYERSFVERVVRLGGESAAIRRVLADLLEGRQPYSTLKLRLVLNAIPCGIQVASRRLSRAVSERPASHGRA